MLFYLQIFKNGNVKIYGLTVRQFLVRQKITSLALDLQIVTLLFYKTKNVM